MKLSDIDIQAHIASGDICLDPMPEASLFGSMSIDLQLGCHFSVFSPGKAPYIDLAPPNGERPKNIEDLMLSVEASDEDPFYLHPGDFALGITIQQVTLSSALVGRLDGRSSLARLGLMVHATAHTIDPGFDGRITLEFFNCGRLPLLMRPGMRICALSFEMLHTPTSRPYAANAQSKYKNQLSPLPSRILHEDQKDG